MPIAFYRITIKLNEKSKALSFTLRLMLLSYIYPLDGHSPSYKIIH